MSLAQGLAAFRRGETVKLHIHPIFDREKVLALLNQRWILRRRPRGEISSRDLELIETAVPELRAEEVLVATFTFHSIPPIGSG